MRMMMMTRIIGELASSSDQEGRRNFVCQAKFWHNRQRQKKKGKSRQNTHTQEPNKNKEDTKRNTRKKGKI